MNLLINESGASLYKTASDLLYLGTLLYLICNTILWIVGLIRRRELFENLMISPALTEMNRQSGFVKIEASPERVHLSMVKFMPLPSGYQKFWEFFVWAMGGIMFLLTVFMYIGLSRIITAREISLSFTDQLVLFLSVPVSILFILPAIYIATFMADRHAELVDVINECLRLNVEFAGKAEIANEKCVKSKAMIDSYGTLQFEDQTMADEYLKLVTSNHELDVQIYYSFLQQKRIMPILIKCLADNLMRTGSNPYQSAFKNALDAYLHPNMYRFQYLAEEAMRRGEMKDENWIKEDGVNRPYIEGQANDLKALIEIVRELKLSQFWNRQKNTPLKPSRS